MAVDLWSWCWVLGASMALAETGVEVAVSDELAVAWGEKEVFSGDALVSVPVLQDVLHGDVFYLKKFSKCPRGGNDDLLELLYLQTPTHFDNLYFKNLPDKKGLFHSDQELFNGRSTDKLVKKYATNADAFFKAFAKGMVKMSNIKTLTES
ncbi:peroxidase 4-like [Cajanus cajan]|uniref:peroxidase 4-like n=1 Tax=Cajanus cajan TaxID=3821 RepID=UPI00098D8288|nr:peroxidase 4-like [Cajanus cajan]